MWRGGGEPGNKLDGFLGESITRGKEVSETLAL